ncbi:MAG TPA: glycosyltransferase family 2 protein, partial [Candidatus Babeliaceae bacterium]|nr:glycosyltransferase family 2 protein [Candidatus Babeliaceae bacterium]
SLILRLTCPTLHLLLVANIVKKKGEQMRNWFYILSLICLSNIYGKQPELVSSTHRVLPQIELPSENTETYSIKREHSSISQPIQGKREAIAQQDIRLETEQTSDIYRQESQIKDVDLEIPERPFVIIIPSFNNTEWCELNLGSVFAQNYSNYRVVYIDDCSIDDTYTRASQFVYKHNQAKRVHMLRNKQRKGALENIYQAVHRCGDHETVVLLDGDDMLGGWWQGSNFVPDRYILKKLNQVYASRDIWLTYGQFQEYPSGYKGWAQPMPGHVINTNGFRDWPHLPTHLRTFIVPLFKKIKLSDLLFRGQFFVMTWDQAMMFPMIEMAGERHAFIDDIMYTYNMANGINDHKIGVQLQRYLAKHIRSKTRYERVSMRQDLARYSATGKETNIMIFSSEAPAKLYALLESVYEHVKGFDSIYVLYTSASDVCHEAYATVKKRFPQVEFVHIRNRVHDEFRSVLVFTFLLHFTSRYTLFAHDNLIVTRDIDLKECIQAVESSGACGFYLSLGKNIKQMYPLPIDLPQPSLHHIYPHAYAWMFEESQGNWALPYNFDMTLYKTETIKPVILKEGYVNLEQLQQLWSNDADLAQAGVCFEESRVIKLVYKHTPSPEGYIKKINDELLEKFQKNLGLDISSFKDKLYPSVAIMYQPQFKPMA